MSRKIILISFILAVLITLYEIADFVTHGNIVGFLINRRSQTSQAKSDFTPRYLGLWTKTGMEIPKCRQRWAGENTFEFSGQDPAPIVQQGVDFICFKGGESNIDELGLIRLEWSQARQVFTVGKNIPFHIVPGYRGKPRMFEILFDPALESGYYAFYYEQNPALVYHFIVIDSREDAKYQEAAEICEKFWKYLMAEKHSKLLGLLGNDLSRKITTQGELRRFRSGFLEEILSSIKDRCNPNDLFVTNLPLYQNKLEELDYSPTIRLDRVRPQDVMRGRIIIPYEVRVSADKLPERRGEMEFEVVDGKINSYKLAGYNNQNLS